jgi:3-oxoacyl-[acyl-carrier-protein] synthase-3
VVHERLGLSETCTIFDLSNACLGVMNAMAQIAVMIDAGQIEAGLAVSGEVAEPLHEATIANLLGRRTLDKQYLKHQFASLTIGSAAAAVLLVRKDLADGPRLIGGAIGTDTAANHLCQADPNQMTPDGPLMSTDSEGLLRAGVDLAARTWARAKAELGWSNDTPGHFFTHQVGKAHAKLTFDTLGLDQERDFPTVSFMGNTGSAALPGALAVGLEQKHFRAGDRTALLGIGSGLSCLVLGLEH